MTGSHSGEAAAELRLRRHAEYQRVYKASRKQFSRGMAYFFALRPELVVEVTFDHTSGGRIRHGTKILRWRDDKAPTDCKLEQMSM